jgi:Zn-dependent alcohol dehydrogenase
MALVRILKGPVNSGFARLGATDLIDCSAGDVSSSLQRAIPGGVDYSFEAIGNPQMVAAAVQLLRRGGTAVTIGLTPQARYVG